jgi:hypothetical protein
VRVVLWVAVAGNVDEVEVRIVAQSSPTLGSKTMNAPSVPVVIVVTPTLFQGIVGAVLPDGSRPPSAWPQNGSVTAQNALTNWLDP